MKASASWSEVTDPLRCSQFRSFAWGRCTT